MFKMWVIGKTTVVIAQNSLLSNYAWSIVQYKKGCRQECLVMAVVIYFHEFLVLLAILLATSLLKLCFILMLAYL